MVQYDNGGNKIVYDDGKMKIIEKRDGFVDLREGNTTIAYYAPGSDATFKNGGIIGRGNILMSLIKK